MNAPENVGILTLEQQQAADAAIRTLLSQRHVANGKTIPTLTKAQRKKVYNETVEALFDRKHQPHGIRRRELRGKLESYLYSIQGRPLWVVGLDAKPAEKPQAEPEPVQPQDSAAAPELNLPLDPLEEERCRMLLPLVASGNVLLPDCFAMRIKDLSEFSQLCRSVGIYDRHVRRRAAAAEILQRFGLLDFALEAQPTSNGNSATLDEETIRRLLGRAFSAGNGSATNGRPAHGRNDPAAELLRILGLDRQKRKAIEQLVRDNVAGAT